MPSYPDGLHFASIPTTFPISPASNARPVVVGKRRGSIGAQRAVGRGRHDYADIDATLAEFARVLTPGGTLVLIVEPLGAPVRLLLTSKWIGNARTIAFVTHARAS